MRLLKEVQNLLRNYHLKSGMYHYYRNEHVQAVEFLRKALKDEERLSPSELRNVRYYMTLAMLEMAERLRAKGDAGGGIEQLRRAAEVSPTYPDIHFRLGLLLEEQRRVDEALAAYRAAIRCNPDYVEAHVALGFCLLRQARPAESAAAFREALEVRRKKTQQPFDEGMRLLDCGELERAAEQFHDTFLSMPELARDCLRKALDFLKSGEHERALTELDRALVQNPRYPDVHNFRGVVLCELDRPEEAVEAFRLSSRLSPHYLVPRLNLAFALIRIGRSRDAEAALESVLELEPDEPVATEKLEQLLSGRPPGAGRSGSRGTLR